MARSAKGRKSRAPALPARRGKGAIGAAAYGLLALAVLSLLEPYVWLGALAAELGAQLCLLSVLTLALSLAARALPAVGAAFVASVLFAGPLAPLYRSVKPTPEHGPRISVAHVHAAEGPLSLPLLSAWLGSQRADVVAITGMRSHDAAAVPSSHAGFQVTRSTRPGATAELLFVREAMQPRQPQAPAPYLSANVRSGRCNVHLAVVNLPSRLGSATLAARAQAVEQLRKARTVARSVWLGHLGSRAGASDLRALLERMALRDSRRGHGLLATAPAALGSLGLPLDHVLVHGWISVRDRRVEPALTPASHRTVRATLELTEPSCREPAAER